MNNFIIKILKAKYTNLFIIILISIIVFSDIKITLADGVLGTIGEIGAGAISGPLGLINKAIGITGTQLVSKLLNSALSFDNFFSVGVTAGWEAVRDFANLFFALILLVMAISTVLDIGALSNYSAKRMLPSFIMTVLLINFSKSIVGIFVDISQIIMLEFYNAIVAGGSGIHDVLLNQGNLSSLQDNNWFDGQVDALTTNLITFFLLLIVTFVLLWIALTLWIRVATIWILIITSPLAFMSMTFPPLKSVWSKWMSELQKVLTEGPMLLFYLYLAVIVLRASGLNSVESGKLDISSYAISIILFIYAKIAAESAAASAPGFAKNIVSTVGSVATLGLSKPAGVGGNMNTGDLLKSGGKISDKLVGGGTRGLQNLTGVAASGLKRVGINQVFGRDVGAIKLNDVYEDRKDDAISNWEKFNPISKTNKEADISRRKSERMRYEESKGIKSSPELRAAQKKSVDAFQKSYEGQDMALSDMLDEMVKIERDPNKNLDKMQALYQLIQAQKNGTDTLRKRYASEGIRSSSDNAEDFHLEFIESSLNARGDGSIMQSITKKAAQNNKDNSFGRVMEIIGNRFTENGVLRGGIKGPNADDLYNPSGNLDYSKVAKKSFDENASFPDKLKNIPTIDASPATTATSTELLRSETMLKEFLASITPTSITANASKFKSLTAKKVSFLKDMQTRAKTLTTDERDKVVEIIKII